MSSLIRRRWVAILVTIQVAVPAVILTMAPSQFGFQMYSGAGWTKLQMEDTSGVVHELAVQDYVANSRGDIDWTERLPERVCEVETAAVRVMVERWRSERSLTCP